MDAPAPASAQADRQRGSKASVSMVWLLFVIVAVMGLCAVSGDSLWIDEAHCAVAAIQPGLSGWMRCLLEIPSDVQMSVYFFQLWGWEKIAGGGEWALRLNNLCWFLLGVGAWLFAVPRALRLPIVLGAGLSPFLWYYLNELRPYMMVFAGSSMVFAALYRGATVGFSRGWFWCFGGGSLIAVSASSAAIPWVGVALIAAGVLWLKGAGKVAFPSDVIGGLALPGLCILALYGLSFLNGARASSPEPSSLASLLFTPYELLGFMGLGPGRGELRTGGVASLMPYLPPMLIYVALLGVVFVAGVMALRKQFGGRRLLGGGALFALPVIAVIGLGLFSGLRTTGRHFTPAFALLLPTLALGIRALWTSKRPGAQGLVVGFLICLAVSCFEIRTAPRHKKDDYRTAAQFALKAVESGRHVWWLANPQGAFYYLLPLSDAAGPGVAQKVVNLEMLPALLPDVIVLGRADVYDRNLIVTNMLESGLYQPVMELQGFVIFEK